MRIIRPLVASVVFLSCVASVSAQSAPISRLDGFLLMWKSIQRPVIQTREAPYKDLPTGQSGSVEVTYAKSRGILNDENEFFRPTEPLARTDALLILFRTRNVEPVLENGNTKLMEKVELEDLAFTSQKYGLDDKELSGTVTQDELMTMMKTLDDRLKTEDHEVSLYSEKFHGKGTGFGETFDMNAMTAAHRTYPHNTLVKVTNIENGKSVTVRINDRGPFVQGRDMDLSLAAFTSIAERSKGKIRARFERLGDVSLVNVCASDRFQRRLTKTNILTPGIPHVMQLGAEVTLKTDTFFALRSVTYPDGVKSEVEQWYGKDEIYQFTPSTVGIYIFRLSAPNGVTRDMKMSVVDCSQW